MPELILIGVVVLAFLGGLRAFERASVGSIMTFLTWLAVLGGLSLMLLLVLTGREGFALGLAVLAGPFLWERWRARRAGAPGARPFFRAGPRGRGRDGGEHGEGTMSREEAYRVLGLTPGAGAAEVRAAHRRLMRTAHPDAGGSVGLASRLNQARDLLLGPRGR